MKTEKVIDPSDGTVMVLFDLGDNTIGVTYPDPDMTQDMEIWHDHEFNGCGCNNLELDAFGRTLDLEFCRSEKLTPDQRAAQAAALA